MIFLLLYKARVRRVNRGQVLRSEFLQYDVGAAHLNRTSFTNHFHFVPLEEMSYR